MKHGKTHRREVEQSLPEWREEFLAYKKLKKEVRLSTEDADMTTEDIGFVHLLEDELDKINTFFFDKEETYIIKLKEMKEKVEKMFELQEIQKAQRDLLEFHGEMIWLLHYRVLNFIGLIKIVKKHSKKAGTSRHSAYILKVLQQPFYSKGLLDRLMEECQGMLKLQQSRILEQLAM